MCHDVTDGILFLLVGKSFNLSQELIVPLHLINHLAMDIFNVEIFASYDESSNTSSVIIQGVIVAMRVLIGVQAEAIVVAASSCLLQRIEVVLVSRVLDQTVLIAGSLAF